MIRIPPLLERELWFVQSHRRLGRFRQPVTFSEKLNWRILYDRRPILAWTCDKLRMKEVAARNGVPSARVLWSGHDLRELVDVRLPDAWVLKPNHSTGKVRFGQGHVTDRHIPELKAVTRGWLDDTQGRRYREWAYSQARRCLLVEEMFRDEHPFLHDYKFFVFDGKPHMLSVAGDRWATHALRFYTLDWEPLSRSCGFPMGPIEPPPETLGTMLLVASRLGEPFDFMRIDLYSVDGTVSLGEFTPYPNGGMRPFRPHAVEQEMGAAWRLPVLE